MKERIVDYLNGLKHPFSFKEDIIKMINLGLIKNNSHDLKLVSDLLSELVEKGLIYPYRYDSKKEFSETITLYLNQRVIEYSKERILTPNDEEYSLYYQSDFTEYEFVMLFCALMKNQRIFMLEDFVNFIAQCYKKNVYDQILSIFPFNKFDIYVNLYNSLELMKQAGYITISEDDVINIKDTLPVVDIIIKKRKFFLLMESMVKDYINKKAIDIYDSLTFLKEYTLVSNIQEENKQKIKKFYEKNN